MAKNPPLHHIPKYFTITDKSLREAVSRFGTPLYLYDYSAIKSQWDLLFSILPDRCKIYYSVKANPNIAIVNVLHELGAAFEIASQGELSAVSRVNIPGSEIIFVGPGKSKLELEDAIKHRLSFVIAESLREIQELNLISKKYDCVTPIALRINPGRGKGMISMGGVTQFGLELSQLSQILEQKDQYKNLEFAGIHAYLGTGILNWRTIVDHTQMILDSIVEMKVKEKMDIRFVDMGGGFGIPYYERDESTDWKNLKRPLARLVTEFIDLNPSLDHFGIESGRFLVGPSGVFLAEVLDVKDVAGTQYVILDGGTNVFVGDDRYSGARSVPFRVLGSEGDDVRLTTICGPLCTSLDRLAADILLPRVNIGDILVFYQAGAYGLTANRGLFLSHGFPAEALFRDDQLLLIRKRQSVADLLRGQRIG